MASSGWSHGYLRCTVDAKAVETRFIGAKESTSGGEPIGVAARAAT
jgi:hypothetical protein